MWTLPWKVWLDEDGKPTQRETDVLVGGQGDRILEHDARALGLINADGTPREPRRGKSTKPDEPDETATPDETQEDAGDGQ
jgi:hypothetical protein